MAFPSHIYKAYDVRGIYPTELNEDLAYATARWFADMRQREVGRADITLVVGQDMRLSSPMIAAAVVRGLTEQGAHVVELGVVSTPTFYSVVARRGFDGGIQVSASHNPREYSGLKFVRDHAGPVSADTGIVALRDLVASGQLPDVPGVVGTTTSYAGDAALESILAAHDFVGDERYAAVKVVGDTANCVGAPDLDALFATLDKCELDRINWTLDGSFPSHEPDPFQEENLQQLHARVQEVGAALGVATDGDADRVFLVDETGKTVSPVALRSLIAEILLRTHKGATIVYDVRPGRITEDVVRRMGGVPLIVRVGHSFIKQTMLEHDAIFAGESSGHFFVRFPDGVYESPAVIVLMVLAEMARTGKKASELFAPYLVYAHSGEVNFRVTSVAEAIEGMVAHFATRSEVGRLDGVSFDIGDTWFNVRGSNTEPLLRLNVEGKTEEAVAATVAEVRQALTPYLCV